jgi:hypothetical protein
MKVCIVTGVDIINVINHNLLFLFGKKYIEKVQKNIIYSLFIEDPVEVGMVKSGYYRGIFAQDYNEREQRNAGINVVISLFHFKKLSSSMLFEYKKKYSAKESEAFGKELNAEINELLELSEMTGETKEFACAFFKFFMQLVQNEILGQSEEWNEYVHFRMRHFHWIDTKVIVKNKYSH